VIAVQRDQISGGNKDPFCPGRVPGPGTRAAVDCHVVTPLGPVDRLTRCEARRILAILVNGESHGGRASGLRISRRVG
jgi:hypothetical protein